ncbi:MAG TPA: DUF72 domain-containing protein [Abditibacteriaceae bacterium]
MPKQYAAHFLTVGSHLERYAAVFRAVEINSSFYRPHQTKTYARWAESVPDDFRFAVKVPKAITHNNRLVNSEVALDDFLEECAGLGEKLGPLLVQLPPSLKYHPETVSIFFKALRQRFVGDVVCEPRHITWFAPEAEELLITHRIARVAADPALTPTAAETGGWHELMYYRLHGSPRIYYSDYSPDYLESLTQKLTKAASLNTPVWCIFDNTAEFAATGNALNILEQLRTD